MTFEKLENREFKRRCAALHLLKEAQEKNADKLREVAYLLEKSGQFGKDWLNSVKRDPLAYFDEDGELL